MSIYENVVVVVESLVVVIVYEKMSRNILFQKVRIRSPHEKDYRRYIGESKSNVLDYDYDKVLNYFLDAIASLNFTLSIPPSLRHHLYQIVPVSIESNIACSIWTLEPFKPLPTPPPPTIHQLPPRNFSTSVNHSMIPEIEFPTLMWVVGWWW